MRSSKVFPLEEWITPLPAALSGWPMWQTLAPWSHLLLDCLQDFWQRTRGPNVLRLTESRPSRRTKNGTAIRTRILTSGVRIETGNRSSSGILAETKPCTPVKIRHGGQPGTAVMGRQTRPGWGVSPEALMKAGLLAEAMSTIRPGTWAGIQKKPGRVKTKSVVTRTETGALFGDQVGIFIGKSTLRQWETRYARGLCVKICSCLFYWV